MELLLFCREGVVINEVDSMNDDESGVYIRVVLFLVMTVTSKPTQTV